MQHNKNHNLDAAIVLIGDEILSGRTQDTNVSDIARFLGERGIDLREVRIVPDVEVEIVDAVNALRARYTYVFTTGGIGPTHDDITADAIAKAFNTGISHHPEAVKMLKSLFAEIGVEPNEARMRMARLPEGAELIASDEVKAPGFHIGNVFVMAGVPSIMRKMLKALAPKLKTGQVVKSISIRFETGEGSLAEPLKQIQQQFPQVSIGSYPFVEEGLYGSNVVLRSRNESLLNKAAEQVKTLL